MTLLSTELMTLPSRSRVETVPAPVTTMALSCAGAVTSRKFWVTVSPVSVMVTLCAR